MMKRRAAAVGLVLALALALAPALAGAQALSGGVTFGSGALALAEPANPTATTSLTGVMMGLGASCKITPLYSTRVFFAFQGEVSNNTASDGTEGILRYGAGSAPANAAAPSGTNPFGAAPALTAQNTAGAAPLYPFHASGIATGLVRGTQVWFDLQLLALTGGTSSLVNVVCFAYEM